MREDMPPPRKHHYLPEWYLSRWKRPWNGKEVIWEFGRVGPKKKLHSRYRHPSATGYAIDLYTIPNRDPEDASEIETKLLQFVDDRGAKAIAMAERNELAGPEDKVGLVRFMLSMLHRSPERIEFLENRLREDLFENPLFADEDPSVFRAGALNVFVDLVQSQAMIERMMELSVFIINLNDNAYDLMTSDSPLMMSNGLAHRDAFVILPTGPRTLVMLAENKSLPQHVAGYSGKIVSKAMNDAVIVQAKKLVFGADRRQERFIDNRLNRPVAQSAKSIDPVTGLVKWKI
ncbi:DUF4238 domain-containing protein [Alteriqipengyuania lutimaris]|uniref:DUF4238 domain-containing protein n=1 Tax=Alteriqipengyuania lutimaris TaxID=1538146 RepID=A0A395LT05_9SPHN|nr:DUF4238 domain-containing protein [Alteriqipengyuania lutimaris]MBB3033292.1 hypothetical protein [Alteriqipengyuania lutimaris]RDS77670.1 DUF4238 domain-containing protein [Alteriqipengyuania lutimaris]